LLWAGGALLLFGIVIGVRIRDAFDPPRRKAETIEKAPESKPLPPPSPKASAEPTKLEVARTLRAKGRFRAHLDPRRPGVQVPARFRTLKQLVLEYGDDMPVPIPDLVLDDRGIAATLSFDRKPVATFVPWSAVFALVDEKQLGRVWDTDAPPDLHSDAGE
jgi:hypothetical protein